MALVKYGAGIVQISGSIAGDVHARNRYANYIRPRTKPTNPNTDLQQQVRNALSYITTMWAETLTNAQRAAWDLYASNVAMNNKLGEVMHLSGFNQFVRSATFRKRYGGGGYLDGPVVFELPATDPTFTITASEATQQITCQYDAGLAWNSEDAAALVMFVGQPQNAQRNFFAGPWQLSAWLPGNAGAPPASPVVIPAKFGIAEGQHLWVYARISRADARLSERFRSDCFCAA